MTASGLPQGRYLTCTWEVKADGGGQTRALFERNRVFCRAGLEPRVLSFVAVPDLEVRRATLLERGQMLPGMHLDTIFDHYRERAVEYADSELGPLSDIRRALVNEESRHDGAPWRRTYRTKRPEAIIFDYQRDDGSTYLRIPWFSFSDPRSWPTAIELVAPDGAVTRRFRSLGGWFREWVAEVAGDERAFMFMDTRVLTPHLVPMKQPTIHSIQVMHNVHTEGGRRWDAPVGEMGQGLLDRMSDLDAVVMLTERQRHDVAKRRGAADNLFVIPNPVQMPREEPSEEPRDPHRATIVARLASQKRLTHAIRVFEMVLDRVPDAKLEIYGDGTERQRLETFIARRGLGDSVTLMGYDPQARDALTRSSVFIMTSRNEGYPLSTLESLSHGCPVVSYDIRYGPREQITDGVNGYLVPDEDLELMADRVVALLTDPALVERMSLAARETAQRHGLDRYERDWTRVLSQVVSQKAERTRLRSAQLKVTRLAIARPRDLGSRIRRAAPTPAATYSADAELSFEARLRVRTPEDPARLDSATIDVAAVQEASGEVLQLPAEVSREMRTFTIRSHARLGDLLGPEECAESVHIRIRLVWHNSVWETRLTREVAAQPEIEVGFDGQDALVVRRTTPSNDAAERPQPSATDRA